MIMKFLGEVRVGLLQVSRSMPVWFIPGYWLDRLENWRDARQDRRDERGPRRPVSRSKVVRRLQGMFHVLGLLGWLWAGLALAGLMWSTKGAGSVNALVMAGSIVAAFRVGYIWNRRNTVMRIEWDDECPCRQWEEDL